MILKWTVPANVFNYEYMVSRCLVQRTTHEYESNASVRIECVSHNTLPGVPCHIYNDTYLSMDPILGARCGGAPPPAPGIPGRPGVETYEL